MLASSKKCVADSGEVATGILVTDNASGKLSHDQVHSMFQNVGCEQLQPAHAKQVLVSNGMLQTRSIQDKAVNAALDAQSVTLPKLVGMLLEHCKNESIHKRILNAQHASMLMDEEFGGDDSNMAPGHAWRLHMHATDEDDARREGGETQWSKRNKSWVNGFMRDIGAAGIGMDGDVAAEVRAVLKISMGASPPKKDDKWALMLKKQLFLMSESRKRRREQSNAWSEMTFSEEHEEFDLLDRQRSFLAKIHGEEDTRVPGSDDEGEIDCEDESSDESDDDYDYESGEGFLED